MKSIAHVLLTLVISLGLVACSQESPTPEQPQTPPPPSQEETQ
jgi:hypothetical protein